MIKKFPLILILSIFSVGACTDLNKPIPTVSQDVYEEVDKPMEVKIPDPVEIQISAVGDIMIHGPQLRAQYDPSKDVYDFKNNFQFMKTYIQGADLALCNLETTLAGDHRKYSSFPRFNSPDAIVDALADAGFDVAVTANNHTLDTGGEGVLRTLQVLKDYKLDAVGTQKNEEDKNFLIKDIQGIKLGIIAYTYETPRWGKYKTLNSLKIPLGMEDHINTFSYDDLDNELKKMEKEINHMKESGAEFIIFYIHWGEEYQRKPNHYQQTMATSLGSMGVDMILGSHPHVLQPVDTLVQEDRKTFIVYSLGNFLSNQRYEILKNPYTEDGLMVNVTLRKDFEKNEVSITNTSYIPTWVHRYSKDGRLVYEILPVDDATEDPLSYHLTDPRDLKRATNSQKHTWELIHP